MPSALSKTEFDLIVVGAGAIGENVADRAAQGGLSVAIVESALVGGECSYWACMPSKALLRPGSALRAAQNVDGARQAINGTLDVPAVLRHRDSVASHWNDDGQVKWVESAGITLIRGHARVTGTRTIAVESDGATTTYAARHTIALCTGSAALLPDIPGLADAQPWTSKEATSAQQVPGRLAILGGGVVATEMATAYATLGADVTVIARSGLLTRNEPFAGELVGAALRSLGATIRGGVETTAVRRLESGAVQLTLDDGTTFEADELLVATGRIPQTQDLGLASVGLVDGEWLSVDDTLRVVDSSGTPVDGGWLYAVGDVNHRALLTHQGKYQGRAAGDVIAARAKGAPVNDVPWGTHVATADHEAVPQVAFTDPEVAAVGLTAAEAEKAGYRTRVVDYDIASIAGAFVHREDYVGQARMVVDEDREVIVGVTFVGPDVAELIHAATVAIVGEVPISRLWHAVPSYPTISEIWLRLLETYGRP